jgi:[acyl-carrier-protein] S-malonyltransferase
MIHQLAVVFPGQGSQSLGMLQELGSAYPQVQDTFAEASDALGQDLWRLVTDGPKEVLDQTENTQPVMLAAGVAVWRVWHGAGGARPAWLAGHSLGELTALACAESLAFSDAVRLVAARGRLMQAAVPAGTGAMAAVLGLDDEQVRAVCAEAAQGEVVEAVNFNAPGQVVIAGHAAAVERALQGAKAAGAKRALPLPVSVPSHCALMRPAAEGLRAVLDAVEVRAPRVPVLHNVTAAPAQLGEIRELLAQQLYSPVRWVDTIRRLAGEGVTQVVECGPGKVLAGLVKRIDKGLTAYAVADPQGLTAALEGTGDA